MHDAQVIDQGHIALLPLQIYGQRLGQADGGSHRVSINGRTVAEANRFAAVVARILPAKEGCD